MPVRLFPEQASSIAGEVDLLTLFLLGVSLFFALSILVLIVFFTVRYRRRSEQEVPPKVETSRTLEVIWTLIPLALVTIMFFWGAGLYFRQRIPPKGATVVYVTAKQWMWKFQHPNGKREINDLHIPVGKPIRLIIASEDVIHSFSVPAFRIKQDVLPGRYTTTWFRATRPGRYQLFCAEYCGTQHSGMIGEIVVMEPAAYQAWLQGGAAQGTLASTGQKLFQDLGCATCHRFDTQGRGPNLQGAFGKQVLLDDGRTVMADDNYVRESILQPGAKGLAGFKPIMPTFQGIVSEEQLLALIAYVKSLSQSQQTEPVSNRPPVSPSAGGPSVTQ
jgi:cytochrome c oxidase subunit 2